MPSTVPFASPLAAQRGLFHPAPLVTLRPDSGALFALYLGFPSRSGYRYILYKAAGIEFSEKRRCELISNGVKTLFVKDDDAAQYLDYVDQTLGQVLASEKTSPAEKSRVLYETAQSLVASTFERPDSPLLLSANRKVVTHTVDSITAEPAMLRTLAALFAVDYSLYSHSVHVCVLATALLLDSGTFTDAEVHDLALGFLLHDIGKARVAGEILHKPGPLTPWEMRQMEKHPDLGTTLLQTQGGLSSRTLNVIRDHHERLDGSGYPRRLNSNNLSLEARVCAVADVFDAMTSRRVYKEAMTAFDALQMILTSMPGTLDDEILHLLIHRLGPNARQAV